jgi:hypothetical protein
MEHQNEITTLVKEALAGESGSFRPCAFFDDRLDCIRVITKDCSVLEERINDRVTMLLDLSAPKTRKVCVGFTLKGAYHLCQQHGWDQTRPIKMSQLLDAIIASVPEKAVKVFIELVAKPLVENENIDQVDMRDGALAHA